VPPRRAAGATARARSRPLPSQDGDQRWIVVALLDLVLLSVLCACSWTVTGEAALLQVDAGAPALAPLDSQAASTGDDRAASE